MKGALCFKRRDTSQKINFDWMSQIKSCCKTASDHILTAQNSLIMFKLRCCLTTPLHKGFVILTCLVHILLCVFALRHVS